MKAILRSINNFSCKLKQSNNLKYNISPKIRSNKFKNISGNGNIVIEDAIKKDLKDYKVYGNTVQSKLPSGYTQVDYIESSGTQYIDTNYIPAQNDNLELKNVSTPNISGTLFSAGTGDYQFILHNNRYFKYFASGAAADIGNDLIFNNANIKIEEGSLYVDNVLKGVSTYGGEVNTTLQLFRRANGGYYKTCSIGEVIITNKNTLVRDFIPCYRNSDNEVGLYDLVNDVFYTNQGTGTFTYGSVAPTPDTPTEMVSFGDRTKNLLNVSNEYSVTTWQEIDVNLQPGDYIVNCTDESTNVESGNTSLMNFYHSDNTYDQLYFNRVNKVGTVTITAETTKVRIYSGSSYTVSNGKTTILTNLMIRKSNISDGTYEPYGKYKVPVNVRSENIYNIHGKSAGSGSVSSEVDIDDNDFISSSYDNINGSNTHYTNVMIQKSSLLQPSTNYLIVCEIESVSGTGSLYPFTKHNDSSINTQHTLYQFSNLSAGQKIIIPVTTKSTLSSQDLRTLVRFDVGQSGSIKFRLSILEDTTITEDTFKYQPYYNETTNIYLDEPLRKIGEYSDYIDFINGKVVRQLGEVILDNNNTWTFLQAYSRRTYYTDVTSLKQSSSNDEEALLFANCFKGYSVINLLQNDASPYGICRRTNKSQILIRNDNVQSINDFQTWISSNPVTVDYVLSTPTEEDIELLNIKLIEGKNIITVGTEVQGVFEAEYYSKEIIDISDYKYNLRKVED